MRAMNTLQLVVLSGGSGTRLWPMSRSMYPKQFLALAGGAETLLQQTICRTDPLADSPIELADPLIVCNESHRFLVAEQLRQMPRASGGILLEPEGRNTAPACTLAAIRATEQGDDPVLLVTPADHKVSQQAAFCTAVEKGLALASEGAVVTFGIVPTRAETGFGYIQRGEPLTNGAFELAGFVEKPDQQRAERYIADGDYLWNSGIFMMRASVWLHEVARLQPEMMNACREAMNGSTHDGDFVRVAKQAFLDGPSDSIDYAVMERLHGGESAQAVVVPLDAGWSDVGAWSALWDLGERDADGNVCQGDAMAHGAHNNLIVAQHRLVSAVGVDDLVIVETPDAVMVTSRARSQDVKGIVQRLQDDDRDVSRLHRCVHRPWGTFESLDTGSRYQVKRLTVNPGAALSLQRHQHRAEHWVVVRGVATVTRNDDVFDLNENESTYLPQGAIHRLENRTDDPLEIIEVQSGSYLGEDDIERLDDVYNRGSTD